MISLSILESAKQVISRAISARNQAMEQTPIYAIDGTVGNGNDTLFLLQQINKKGIVYGFDIQQEALATTQTKLQNHQIPTDRYQLFHADHSQMEQWLPDEIRGKVTAIMFNLGYLPHSNSPIITKPETTIKALTASLSYLGIQGVCTVAIYTGHQGGKEEETAIIDWAKKLPSSYYVTWKQVINRHLSPSLLTIEKKRMAFNTL